MEKKLYRDENRKVIGGVCAGLADYLGIDVTILRIIFVVAGILKGSGLIAYIILWIVVPKRSFPYMDPTVDYTVPPGNPPPFADPFANMPPMPPMPKRKSSGALVVGIVMITLGVLFLVNQLDILPYLSLKQIWPVVFVVTGLAIMFSGNKQEPWKKFDNYKDSGTVNPPNDNPPTETL